MIMKKGFTSSLRHKIIVEKPVLASDGAGGYTKTWETVAVLWAAIIRRAGKEDVLGGKITAQKSYIFRMRYTDVVTSDMRINYDGRPFNIRSLNNVEEQDAMLEILAEEGVAL